MKTRPQKKRRFQKWAKKTTEEVKVAEREDAWTAWISREWRSDIYYCVKSLLASNGWLVTHTKKTIRKKKDRWYFAFLQPVILLKQSAEEVLIRCNVDTAKTVQGCSKIYQPPAEDDFRFPKENKTWWVITLLKSHDLKDEMLSSDPEWRLF